MFAKAIGAMVLPFRYYRNWKNGLRHYRTIPVFWKLAGTSRKLSAYMKRQVTTGYQTMDSTQ